MSSMHGALADPDDVSMGGSGPMEEYRPLDDPYDELDLDEDELDEDDDIEAWDPHE